ncbi:hypothetical protein R8510_04732 [Ralstonia chuxiongensis]|nr:hypothetical protein R8510_04732 [Ralstonia chuxiongensis]
MRGNPAWPIVPSAGLPGVSPVATKRGANVHRSSARAAMPCCSSRFLWLQVCGVSRRRWITTTRRSRRACPAPDLAQRQLHAEAPNRLWVADVAYIATGEGFLYLAVALDVFSRRIVGWAVDTHLYTALMLRALDMALLQRRPEDVIHHSDRGCPVHLARLRPTLSRIRRTPLDGLGWRRVRQRDLRKLLHYARIGAARTRALLHARTGSTCRIRVHRGLVQHNTLAQRHRSPLVLASREVVRPKPRPPNQNRPGHHCPTRRSAPHHSINCLAVY